jgi:hypothetical protein
VGSLHLLHSGQQVFQHQARAGKKTRNEDKDVFSNEVGLKEWTDSLKFGGFTWVMAVLVL